MMRLLPASKQLQQIKRRIRTLFLLSIFILFCGGVFLQDSSIYAQDNRQTNVVHPKLYESDTLPERGFAPKTITVRGLDFEQTHLVYSDSAKDILSEVKYSLDGDDEILPGPNEYIPHNGKIVIVKVHSEVFVQVEMVPFSVKRVEDEKMDKGQSIVEVEGQNGVLEKTIRVLYKDEVAYRSEVTAVKIVIAPITKVVRFGTKPVTVHSCAYWNKVINEIAPRSEQPEKNAWMRYVMYCESGCNSGNDKSSYYGLYQFTKSTYFAYGGTNIWDGHEQIEIVSKMYDLPGNAAHHWPACNKAFERDSD
ncbi:G5 domain-containing protein [bacterium]|nr:G5 domain-containing protein [bacterium]